MDCDVALINTYLPTYQPTYPPYKSENITLIKANLSGHDIARSTFCIDVILFSDMQNERGPDFRVTDFC